MKRKRGLIIGLALVAFFGIIALIVFLRTESFDTRLSFRMMDAVSEAWVWDAEVRLQNRKIKAYYQSDEAPKTYEFTNLNPGRATLEISAASYVPVSREIDLSRGENVIEEPIRLIGYEIPDLQKFIIFEERSQASYLCELRPVGSDGTAVKNHPCLDLWIGLMVSARESSSEGEALRGEVLYTGPIDWNFDPRPETSFRYTAVVPYNRINPSNAEQYIFDYLIILPDPRRMQAGELETIIDGAPALDNIETLLSYLDGYEEKLDYYTFTSNEVEGLGR